MVNVKYTISSVGYNFGTGCDTPSIVLGLNEFEKETGDKYVEIHGVFLYLTKSEFSDFTNKKLFWDGSPEGTEKLRPELIGKTGRFNLALE